MVLSSRRAVIVRRVGCSLVISSLYQSPPKPYVTNPAPCDEAMLEFAAVRHFLRESCDAIAHGDAYNLGFSRPFLLAGMVVSSAYIVPSLGSIVKCRDCCL